MPEFRLFEQRSEELDYINHCVSKWMDKEHIPNGIAILVSSNKLAESIAEALNMAGIPNHCLIGRDKQCRLQSRLAKDGRALHLQQFTIGV